MAKEVKAKIKLQIPGGSATPAPPVGSALGQHGVNIKQFCDKFNKDTGDKRGQTVPVLITVYTDRSFDYIIKSSPTTELIKKKINLTKGSSRPRDNKVGTITWNEIAEIAKVKLADLNAFDLEQAKKIIAGSARSMGVEVID